ncbi:MAG: type transporter [Ignavibacteria bacterium]|nr:type transporter [Ignavibacteria bacterium]
MLPIIFIMPLFQLLVLSYAATFEIKAVNVHLIDYDKSSLSRQLINKFEATNRFFFTNSSNSEKLAFDDLATLKAKLILIVPAGFEKDIVTSGKPKLQFILNSEDGSAAGVIQSYCAQIIADFNRSIIAVYGNLQNQAPQQASINVLEKYWYNPELNYKFYMVPGILVMLVTMIGMFLCSMNIVIEKEMGTIEQLNVTPIAKHEFIIGKLLPFWVLGLIELAFGLSLAKLFFDIPIVGNIFLLFGLASVYLLVVLSFGLLVSTVTETQQQAMFISWFFMVIFILLSGLFTSIDSMPEWARFLTKLNPIAYFVEIMRQVLLKGAGLAEVKVHLFALSIYAIVMIVLSVWRYRKTTG